MNFDSLLSQIPKFSSWSDYKFRHVYFQAITQGDLLKDIKLLSCLCTFDIQYKQDSLSYKSKFVTLTRGLFPHDIGHSLWTSFYAETIQRANLLKLTDQKLADCVHKIKSEYKEGVEEMLAASHFAYLQKQQIGSSLCNNKTQRQQSLSSSHSSTSSPSPRLSSDYPIVSRATSAAPSKKHTPPSRTHSQSSSGIGKGQELSSSDFIFNPETGRTIRARQVIEEEGKYYFIRSGRRWYITKKEADLHYAHQTIHSSPE
jgi:hypothetical protein